MKSKYCLVQLVTSHNTHLVPALRAFKLFPYKKYLFLYSESSVNNSIANLTSQVGGEIVHVNPPPSRSSSSIQSSEPSMNFTMYIMNSKCSLYVLGTQYLQRLNRYCQLIYNKTFQENKIQAWKGRLDIQFHPLLRNYWQFLGIGNKRIRFSLIVMLTVDRPYSRGHTQKNIWVAHTGFDGVKKKIPNRNKHLRRTVIVALIL